MECCQSLDLHYNKTPQKVKLIYAWEQRKFSELGDLSRGKSRHRPRNDKILYDGDYPFIQTGDVAKSGLYLDSFSQTYSEYGIQQSKLWDEGTLVITIAANIAESAILVIKAAFPDSIIGFETKNSDVVFVKFALDRVSDLLRSKVETSSQANLNHAKLSDIVFVVPTITEQFHIGSFFRTLDNTIAIYKRKLNGLRELKKAYLQQMLPQEGEVVPRVRFAGFSEPWRMCKLADVADVVGGGTPDTNTPDFWGSEIDWYAPAEIGEQIYVVGSQRKITSLGLLKSSATMLPVGTVLFTSRAGIGNTAILKKEGATNQGFQSIVPHKNELDSYFIFSRTHELKRYGETVGAGSTFVEVSGKQMAAMSILIPILPEQTAIGQLFCTLDEQEVFQNKRIEQLHALKKAYLQKMFI